jgi:hypothetical protein
MKIQNLQNSKEFPAMKKFRTARCIIAAILAAAAIWAEK